jgi:hypothetical protein
MKIEGLFILDFLQEAAKTIVEIVIAGNQTVIRIIRFEKIVWTCKKSQRGKWDLKDTIKQTGGNDKYVTLLYVHIKFPILRLYSSLRCNHGTMKSKKKIRSIFTIGGVRNDRKLYDNRS